MSGDAAVQCRTPEDAVNPTAALVERIFRLAGEIPGDARRMSGASLLDWIAVTQYGAHDPMIDALVADAMEEGGGLAALVGRTERDRIAR